MSRTEATIGNPLGYQSRATDQLPSAFMATMMLATTPQAMQDLLAPRMTTGSIREYSQVGDGVQLRQHPLLLLPLGIGRVQQRPQMVRKVSVVGSHVLRYLSRSSNAWPRRPQFRSIVRARMSRIHENNNHRNASTFDRVDEHVDLARDSVQPPTESGLGLLRIQPESYAMRHMLASSSDDDSFLGRLNWKVYLGMLCIMAMQALLKLAFQHIFKS
ncbi:hypothetical protein AWZ03_005563 [Drosophila navojoa]|uniref:Uncharacterized protein n=1 Tax=Drosophila navojoa TaxID=7232 RepID=A0A484BJG2_DRONA|nr:hypothetical protein AWZ03_005563 [Drosophila navojoa]